MKIKLLLFAFLINLTFLAKSQVIVWGAGSSDPIINNLGRFANDFGTANSWTAKPITTNALWERSTTGISKGFYSNQLAINSPSMSDGVAIFDSDYLDNGGVEGGVGSSPAPHRGELHSPVIDLTGYKEINLQVKMFLYYRPFDIADMSIGFSSDGGSTWRDYSIDQGVAKNKTFTGQFVAIPLIDATNGINDLTNCKLRLTFDGDSYFLMVDDLSLVDMGYDIAIAKATAKSGYISTAPPIPYMQYPLRLAKGYKDPLYAAAITNYGSKNIPASANPKLSVELLKENNGNWISLFKNIIAINRNIPLFDTIMVNGKWSASMQNAFNTNGAGRYRFTYTLTSDLADADGSNSTSNHDFTITGDYDWFSAVQVDNKGVPQSTDNLAPIPSSGTILKLYEVGTFFYFPDTTGLAVDSVKFKYSCDPNKNFKVDVIVYRWDDADRNGDFAYNELVPVTYKEVQVYGNKNLSEVGMGTVQGNYYYKLSEGNSKDGLLYVSLKQYDQNGLIGNGPSNCAFPGFYITPYQWNKSSDRLAYTPIRVVESSSGMQGIDQEKWYTGFSANNSSLALSLKMINSASVPALSILSSSNKILTADIYPNPAEGILSISIDPSKSINDATLIITHLNGQVIKMEPLSAGTTGVYTTDVSELLQGTYLIHIRSNEGIMSGKFVKK